MASKAEYLKKYLSSDPNAENKDGKVKKKRKIKKSKNIVIHDDDIDWTKLAPKLDEDLDDDPEEAPIIIDITEDKPEMSFKWKAVKPADPVDLAIVKVEKETTPPSTPTTPTSKVSSNKKRKTSRREKRLSVDLSPPRRSSPTDMSPPRRRRKDSDHMTSSHPDDSRTKHNSPDFSPPRKQRKRDSNEFSRRRRSRHDSYRSDVSSPTRRPFNELQSSPPLTVISKEPPISDSNTGSTLSGAKVGLQYSNTLKEDIARANAERERFIKSLDPLISGKSAATVYRDKEGKRIDPNKNPLTEEEIQKKKEEDELFDQWGRGIAQVQSAQEKLEDDLYEMSKPLARYKDDEDLERLLKEREREGDPMLKFLKKKKHKKGDKNEKEDVKPQKRRQTYQGSWPQNRFGIPPGYRWDGIDRSNGYENSRYALKAEKVAIKEIAYKWSVEDM